MSFARDVYTATEEQTDFTITFPYIEDEHVDVYQEGVLLTEETDYTIVSETTIRLTTEATADDVVVIVRNTSQSTRLVDYASASTLSEEDLDTDSLQAFYLCQEAIDSAALALGVDSSDLWDAQGVRITEVADPTGAQDAATKEYVDEVMVAEGNLPASLEAEDGEILVVTTEGAVSWAELAEAYVPDGLIDAGMLAALTITEAELAAESVIGSKIETGGIGEANLAAESVTLAKIESASGAEHQILKNEEATSVVWFAPPFKAKFVSSDTEYTDGTEVTFAHGLPEAPDIVQVFAVCEAESEDYDPGDVILVPVGADRFDEVNHSSNGLSFDGTNVVVSISSEGIRYPNKGINNDTETLTAANFLIRVVALA